MVSLTGPEVQRLARLLLVGYDAGRPSEPFTGQGPDWLSLPDAYRIQHAVAALRRARGERCVGYKIGCVGSQIQRQLGISQPVWGRLWDTEAYPSGSCLSRSRFANLAVEGEIALRLARDISANQDELCVCIDNWFPVIELHHYVFRGTRPTAQELVANNALHAGFVSGPQPGDRCAHALVALELNVEVDGERVAMQTTSAVPGGLPASLSWLASGLALAGETLKAGDFILTGSAGRLIPVAEGIVSVVSPRYGRADLCIR